VTHDRADRDAGVEVAGVRHVAHGTAVGATLGRLELVDDLHRPDLRRAAQGAGREGSLQDVERVTAGLELAGHVTDQVHHVRIALDLHEFGDLDGAELGDATDVVASEVDQHDVLGALLGVILQPFLDLAILGLGRAARVGSGDRS
jgi:hypothetical protein